MALKLNKFKNLFVTTEEVEETDKKTEEVQKNTPVQKTTEKTSEKKVEIKNNNVEENKNSGSKMSWKTTANQNNTEVVEENIETPEKHEGELNQKIFDQLSQAISDANLPGEDYLEFMEALAAMKDLQIDETIKFQTVFATLSTKGLTKQKVIESADYYLKVLENEKSKFYEMLNSAMKGQINTKLNEITQLEATIKEKEDKILTLQEEIKQSKQVVMKVKNDIQQSDGKIKKTEIDFQFTYDKIANSIKNKIEKVKSI